MNFLTLLGIPDIRIICTIMTATFVYIYNIYYYNNLGKSIIPLYSS